MVDNENKHEFVQKDALYRLYTSVEKQIDNFITGFHEVIPRELISMFDHKEVELLISGLQEIDIDDMKRNTEYKNYSETDLTIVWFWEVMYSMKPTDKAEWLQFVTGSSKVPI